MMHQNKVFDANGTSRSQLEATLHTALLTSNGQFHPPHGYEIDSTDGIRLYYGNNPRAQPFPRALSVCQLAQAVWKWLHSPRTYMLLPTTSPDIKQQVNGHYHIVRGFRVSSVDWGRRQDTKARAIAVRPYGILFDKSVMQFNGSGPSARAEGFFCISD